MKTQMTIPYFTIDAPYELAYRNNGTSSPARPHTHNALEIYLTMSDLPDVLLDDTVSSVSKGSLIIIPPHHVHQLFNQKLTIYERYVLNINSDWLYTVLGAGSGLMPYADPAFSPAILRLSPTGLTGLCSQLDHYLQLPPQPSLSAYADFFSLLSILDSRIQHGLQASSTGQRSISQSQKNRFPSLQVSGLPHCPQSCRGRRNRRCDPVSLSAEDLRLSCVENGNTSRPADGDLQSFFFSDHKTLSGN